MCARPSDPNLRIDLLRAAEEVFVEHGLDRAKVEDITARAGRSKGAFYLHFESKEDAFRQIVEGMVARLAAFLDRFKQEAPPASADREELRRRWLEADTEMFEFIWQNRGVSRLLFEGGNSARFGYLIDEFAERARAHLREQLAEGVRLGMHRHGLDVELASLVIAGAYDRVGRELVRMKERPDLRRWLGELQLLVLRGIERDEDDVSDRKVTNGRAKAKAPRPAARTSKSAKTAKTSKARSRATSRRTSA